MYKLVIRPVLFFFDPEKTHYIVFNILRFLNKIPGFSYLIRLNFVVKHPSLERNVFGLSFKNPVGLAAGFDKNAELYNELADFGFSFIEVGTITPKAQEGNPKKRLFRLKKDNAIINYMGINNLGVEQIIKNLKKNKRKVIIGGNISKNTSTSEENAIEDYKLTFKKLHSYVDYFVINISCPNVENSKKLQDKDYLLDLMNSLKSINQNFNKQKPILLKISPDLSYGQLDDIIEIIYKTKIDGIIATNTSVNRGDLKTSNKYLKDIVKGGLSGEPIKNRSTEVIQYLSNKSNKSFPIIGVGGVHSPQDAIDKIKAGADLVQLYTGIIYEGLSLVKKINKTLM